MDGQNSYITTWQPQATVEELIGNEDPRKLKTWF